MKQVYKMKYIHPILDEAIIDMVPYSSEYQDKYKTMYNECYHEMRESLDIKPYDFIQDNSFFDDGMENVYILLDGEGIIGSVALKGEEIDDLIVDKKYQGKGYGKKILIWAIKHMNASEIILYVAEWNERAIKLYRNNGFEIIERFEI